MTEAGSILLVYREGNHEVAQEGVNSPKRIRRGPPSVALRAPPPRKRGGFAILSCCLLAANAPAPDPFQTLYQSEKRVATIAYRLQSAGIAYCPDKMPLWGMVLHDLAQYAKGARAAAAEHFKLGDLPAVLAVVPGGPADKARMREGESLAAIDGARLPTIPANAWGYATLAAVEARLDAAKVPNATFALIGDLSAERPIRLTSGCRSRVQIIPGRKLNASADGFYVQLTNAMIAEAASDDELAFVIAHEMGHNILGHLKSDLPGKIKESEADILALKLMRAAHYDLTAAARFWAKFGKKTGYGIFSDGSHLRTKARVRLLETEAAKLAQ